MDVDPYEVLGVSRDASLDEIKEARRELIKFYHPDRHQEESAVRRRESARRQQELNDAYAAILEIQRRERGARERAQQEQERGAREQAEREQAQREQAQREQAQREQAQREQAQREQAQREQAQREQAQREQASFTDPSGLREQSVVFSPNGKMLAACDGNGQIYVWNAATGRKIVVLTDPNAGEEGAQWVAFSPNGGILASGDSNGSTYLWKIGGLGT